MPDLLRFLAVCFVWGASFWLMKEAGAVFGAWTIGATRVVLAGAVLGAWVKLRKPAAGAAPGAGGLRAALRGRRAAWGFGFVVVLGFVYPFWMQPLLIGRLQNSGFIGMTVAIVPLSTIAASAVLLRRRPTRREWVGVLAGLAAMPLLAGAGAKLGVGAGSLLLALSIPFVYACSNTVIRATLSGVGAVRLTAGACGAAALVLVPLAAGEPVRWAADPAGNLRAAAALATLGLVGTGLALALFNRLIQTRGPLYAGMVTYVIPVEALLLGWLDGEPVAPAQLLALAVILASVAVVQWPAGPGTPT